MTKIVYNAPHGGFGLSDAAMIRYAEIKGLKLYPEQTRFGFTTWWTVPTDQRSAIIPDEEWYGRPMEECDKPRLAKISILIGYLI